MIFYESFISSWITDCTTPEHSWCKQWLWWKRKINLNIVCYNFFKSRKTQPRPQKEFPSFPVLSSWHFLVAEDAEGRLEQTRWICAFVFIDYNVLIRCHWRSNRSRLSKPLTFWLWWHKIWTCLSVQCWADSLHGFLKGLYYYEDSHLSWNISVDLNS